MKVFCKYCDAYIDIEKEMFCPNCGAEISIKQKTHNGVGQKLEIQKAKKDLETEIIEYERVYRNMLDTFSKP
jgi:predicted amidophosphoribosyltransferase